MGMNYQDEILYISTRIKELRKERKLTVQELTGVTWKDPT